MFRRIRSPFLLFITAIVALLPPELYAQMQSAPLQHEQRWVASADGAIKRSYLLDIPRDIHAQMLEQQRASVERSVREKGWPLVLVLHGGGGNANQIRKASGMSEVAVKENFFVVYPNGTSRLFDRRTWNAGACCAANSARKNNKSDLASDDEQYINQVLDDMLTHFPVDPKRIYISGLSNGGMMTYRLASALNHRIAAAAVVSGAMFADQALPAAPMPILIMHGRKDEVLPWEGGTSPVRRVERVMEAPTLSVDESFAFWLKANGCDASPKREQRQSYAVYRGQQCAGRGAVQLFELFEAGHAWPGGALTLPARRRGENPEEWLDASQTIWNFFSATKR